MQQNLAFCNASTGFAGPRPDSEIPNMLLFQQLARRAPPGGGWHGECNIGRMDLRQGPGPETGPVFRGIP